MFFLSAVSLFTLLLLCTVVVLSVILLVRFKKIEWAVYAFFLWIMCESVLLIHVPKEYAGYLKYAPEVVLYLTSVTTLVYAYIKKRAIVGKQWWLLLGVLVVSSCCSWILNNYHFTIWVLGLRQMFRFVAVTLLLVCLGFQETMYQRIIQLFAVSVVVQVAIGVLQMVSGGALDHSMIASDDVSLGGLVQIGAFEEWWRAGTRMYGTLGRYDRFGAVMAVAVIGAVAAWYAQLYQKKYILWFGCIALVGLYFSASRASMIMALVGSSLIGLALVHDRVFRRWVSVLVLGVLVLVGIKAFELGSISRVVQQEQASFAERVLEAVSPRALRESYHGYGRIYFWVEVPRTVIASAPLFGVGPGRFGGGVAVARVDTAVYDHFGLPFGIQDTYGQIDSSILVLISEFGLVGFVLFVVVFVYTMSIGRDMYLRGHVPLIRFLGALGYALPVGMLVLSCFGPYLELRAVSLIWFISVGMILCGYYAFRRYPANFIVS